MNKHFDIAWNQPPWQDIRPERLCNWMGENPDHFSRTGVKVAWDETAVHLFFRVEDRFVRAIATHHQQSVCGDSCVEFFFTPGPDVFPGCFNLEMHYGARRGTRHKELDEDSGQVFALASLHGGCLYDRKKA